MRKYHRLCIKEREEIYRLKRELWSNKKIAKYLGREVSTIGRELKRHADATPISERPEIINSREEFGHWEGDLLIFTKTSPNITTMVERKSRYVLLRHNENKVTGKVMYNLKSKLKRMPPCARRSITFDRGAEFASHKLLNYSLNKGTYFCNPYSPWEKGSNENFNGRLRRFFPKKVMPTDLSQTKLNEIQKIMNDTPRKCLGYKTPTEAFRYLRKISSA